MTSTASSSRSAPTTRFRAYDTDTGKVLWAADVAGTFRGGPAMYTLDGRQDLLLPAAGTPYTAGNQPGAALSRLHPPSQAVPLGYLAFALPEGR